MEKDWQQYKIASEINSLLSNPNDRECRELALV